MVKVMDEVHLTTVKPKNEVLLLAQEISFAKVLACNDKRLRDRGVRRLRKWFMARSQGSVDFTKEDHMRIWKGLFYCMWMSDKPLIQEELADEISNLIHSFSSFKASLLFVETFFTSLSVEWFGIDQLRLDKFMMLVRRFMRQSLELVGRLSWPEDQVQQLADVYHTTLSSAPMGLCMHIIEIFCEELAKVGKDKLSTSTVLQFITVFARILATLKDGRLISQITRYVFLHLIRQTELGIEHQMKFSAWKEFGFPGGDVNAAEKIEVNSDSEEEEMDEVGEERETGVDARAGKVDVLLPSLDFNPKELLQVLRDLRNKKETTTKARKTLIQLISKFENLDAGKYPLGVHKVELPSKTDKKKEITRAAKRLHIEEQKLIESESDVDGEEPVASKKKFNKKKKTTKQIKPIWKVSEADESGSQNDSGSNTSWEVSESRSKASLTSNQIKKRKLDEDQSLDLKTLSSKEKKAKASSVLVNESKENSFSSPVASTPKKSRGKNILEKSSNNNQNISEVDVPVLENIVENKTDKRLKKRKKGHINQGNSDNSLMATTSEDVQSITSINEVNNHLPTEDEPHTPGSSIVQSNVKRGKTKDLQLNTSTEDKNNGWGGEWEEPLKDGEYEIFIPNKKYVNKRKSLGLSYPVSSFVQKSASKLTPANKLKKDLNKSTPGSQKKVEFNLSANCSQDYKDYTRQVKSSKSQVPFDAAKKPVQGLLKNSTPSPINPFYRKKLKFLTSPNNVSNCT